MEVVFNSLVDRAALGYLKSKKLLPGFSHYDVWLYEHAVAFTVAKMMDKDMLADVQTALTDAMENGTTFADFKKRLKPYLMAKGWWGESVMADPVDGVAKTVQLGSTRRLRTIFHTNLQTSYAAGRWARIQKNKKYLPYLKYIPSVAGQRRDAHKPYYNMILPVEHELWNTIFPPNGYGCLCGVRQLTRKQALRERGEDIEKNPDAFTDEQKKDHAAGRINDNPNIQTVEFTNPRTGQTVRIPANVTPSFAHNHGDRVGALDALMQSKHGNMPLKMLIEARDEYLAAKAPALAVKKIFESSESIIAEGKRLFEKHKETIMKGFERGSPHKAIVEVMKAEGVDVGGIVSAYGSDNETIEELTEALKRYPKAWIEKSNEMGRVFVEGDIKRAWHLLPNPDDELFLKAIRNNPEVISPGAQRFRWAFMGKKKTFQKGDSMILSNLKQNYETILATHVHEFGHRLQSVMPELDGYFTRLWKERTKDDEVQTLREMTGIRGYRADEKGKRDDFPDAYYGKMYGNENNPLPLEMLTMTFEAILGGNTKDFAKLAEKPDFLYFGLALLVRYKP